MDFLEAVSRGTFYVLVVVISKIMIFFWTLYRFMFGYPRIQQQQLPSDPDFEYYEENSEDIGVIRLFRKETPFETFIYGHCLNDLWHLIFKGVLRERKDNGENEFYIYTDDSENEMVEAIRVPAPITVSFLDNLELSEAD